MPLVGILLKDSSAQAWSSGPRALISRGGSVRSFIGSAKGTSWGLSSCPGLPVSQNHDSLVLVASLWCWTEIAGRRRRQLCVEGSTGVGKNVFGHRVLGSPSRCQKTPSLKGLTIFSRRGSGKSFHEGR